MRAALIISDRDNVATALEPLEPGQHLDLNGRAITVVDRIPPGHKVALSPIAKGEAVIKYGSSIGTATLPIQPGAHVHTHNVASGRGRGDVEPSSPDAAARLAEPPDDGNVVERAAERTTRRPG